MEAATRSERIATATRLTAPLALDPALDEQRGRGAAIRRRRSHTCGGQMTFSTPVWSSRLMNTARGRRPLPVGDQAGHGHLGIVRRQPGSLDGQHARADPDTPGPDGRSLYALAAGQGRADLAALLRRYGAADDTTGTDRFLAACQHADPAAVQQHIAQDPGLPGRLTTTQQAAAMVSRRAGRTFWTGYVVLGYD